jgi:hypothetical protein
MSIDELVTDALLLRENPSGSSFHPHPNPSGDGLFAHLNDLQELGINQFAGREFDEATRALASHVDAISSQPIFTGVGDYVASRTSDLANGRGAFDMDGAVAAVASWFDPIVSYFSNSNTAVPPSSPSPEDADWADSVLEYGDSTPDFVPMPILVGVETNPGPDVTPRKLLSELKQAEKIVEDRVRSLPGGQKHKPQPKRGLAIRVAQSKHKDNVPTSVAAAFAHGYKSGAPRIRRGTGDSVYIEHRELVYSVTGTANFYALMLIMQPGLSSVFPWLSTQTNGWEKYRFKYLRARYATRTGSNTPGTLMLIPDYDATDALVTSEVGASSFHGSTNDAPWKDSVVVFDMARSRELFLRQANLAPNLDPKTYDFASLTVASQDGTTVGWGKVWLEYGIELIQSQAITVLGAGGSIKSGGTNVAVATPFGDAPVISASSIITTVNAVNPTRFNFTNAVVGGEYVVTVNIAGTTVTGGALASDTMTSKTAVSFYANAAGTQFHNVNTFTAGSTAGYINLAITAAAVSGVTMIIAPLSNLSVT